MTYSAPTSRAAYLAGAIAAADSAVIQLPAAKALEVEDWLSALGKWTEGPPPEAPHLWR